METLEIEELKNYYTFQIQSKLKYGSILSV